MVRVIAGSSGFDIRVGTERGMVQFWVVPKGTASDSSAGWLVLIPPVQLESGLHGGRYNGESWRHRNRSMTVTKQGERTSVRVHTPADSSGLGTTVDAAAIDQAVRECVDALA